MKQLVILVAATNAVGHYNACTGATLPLVKRGHRVIFVVESAFAGSKSPLGYIEHVYHAHPPPPEDKPTPGVDVPEFNPGEWLANFLFEQKVIGPYHVEEKTENMISFMYSDANLAEFTRFNTGLKEAIELHKPDLIYFDSGALMPAIAYSGIPWVKNVSVTPIFFTLDDELPPGGSGLPNEGDREEWARFNEIRREVIHSKHFSKHFVQGLGYPAAYPNDSLSPDTQCLTVYGYPEELNYPAIRKKGWFNLEVFNRNEVNQKEVTPLEKLVPEKFLNDTLDGRFSGKYIYLSMGSMGSVDLTLMKRLVELLSTSNHKFIVSKGPRYLEFDLARNMYGDRYVSQVKLLRHVDLVITHGGNNTVCEAFAEGLPMIVLPLFADQFDNAQRLQETGFGVRLDAYRLTKEDLASAINKLLYNDKLRAKLQSASARILSSPRHEELADRIEQLVRGQPTSVEV